MEIHTSPRGGGKTTNAIAWMVDNDGLLLSVTAEASIHAMRLAQDMGLEMTKDVRRRFLVAGVSYDRLRGSHRPAALDDLDCHIAKLCGGLMPEYVTMSAPAMSVQLLVDWDGLR